MAVDIGIGEKQAISAACLQLDDVVTGVIIG